MRFEFATATRIVFGAGALNDAGKLAADRGRRALVVTGKNSGRAARLCSLLRAAGVEPDVFSVAGEPSIPVVLEGVAAAKRFGADVIIGFGGGSAIDAAKAIAGLATNPGDPLDYLEVVGRNQPLSRPTLPWVAIPTTAGTGAEVTRNAVLSVPERRVKVSLRSPLLLPTVALVDPELTLDLPAEVTASSGLDALTQLIEAYVCIRANPMTDALCAESIPRVARALPLVWREPNNLAARADLALGALNSGIALANAGLGAVHGFAGPLGGMFDAPHGAICAALLAPVTRVNIAALAHRAPESSANSRYAQVGRWLAGRDSATANDGVAWIEELVTNFRIPRLRAYRVDASQSAEIVARARQASSMKANPIALTDEELSRALAEAI